MDSDDQVPSELDPLLASRRICDDYLRYIQTAFPLKHRGLRDQFRSLVQRKEFLVKGPFLEGTPRLRVGRTIRQMVTDGVLTDAMADLDGHGFPENGYPIDRPLYAHQERSIRKIVAGRNVVVATGTGSGKTEAFLIPIIDHLLRESEAGTLDAPGVRALLLYPMNALANDQLKRLRRLLAEVPTITFGRYTGQTEEHRDKAEEDFRRVFPQEPRVENELICRDDIREQPPHILLTNYAMLEYLLMRPADTTLFDGIMGTHWAFIVVDEAHTYSGAAGMEVGMLLRRLKDRVVRSRPGSIRCVATSATLGRGRADFPPLARFAMQLFGEQFGWDDGAPEKQDIVEAEFEPQDTIGAPWGVPPPDLYPALRGEGDDIEGMASAARRAGVPDGVVAAALSKSANAPWAFLHALLRGDRRVHEVRSLLAGQPSLPALVENVCERILGDSAPSSLLSLTALVSLCARGREGRDSAPLLPARYHLFARALEGAFVTFPAKREPRLYLNTVDQIVEDGKTCQSFEIAACTRCGEVFLTGLLCGEWTAPHEGQSLCTRLRPHTNRWSDLDRPGSKAFFTWDAHGEINADEDEATLAGGDLAPGTSAPWSLCTACGALAPGVKGPPCTCGAERGMTIYEAPMKGGRLATCPSCGAQTPYEDVANRLLTGQDAPVAVLATSLYQLLPGEKDSNSPGQARKLLIFSDSRQDAAYFAPYLDFTHKALLHRRLITEALDIHHRRYGDEPARPLSLADGPLRELTRNLRIFDGPPDPAREQKDRCTWLFQELLSFERRIGIEGSGLLAVRYSRPEGWSVPERLVSAPWSVTLDEAWTLAELLLDTIRFAGAMCVEPADVTGPEFEPRNRSVYYRELGSDGGPMLTVLGWLPRREGITNRRLDYLTRLLRRLTGEPVDPGVATQILTDVWRSLTPARPTVLKPVILKGHGVAYHLNPSYVELHSGASSHVRWFRCNVCRALSAMTVGGVCPTMGCPGEMEPFDPAAELADHHYRDLYRRMLPVPMKVREHTAQWAARKAAEIQQEFLDGQVNVLSCSTTFELGVDVGQLQAVLMRNVPPSTSRYVQRAGRAGRRTDMAAFALTYAQRRPHDLAHYASPEQFITGRIKPPAVELRNPKIIRRHIHSVALAEFFHRHPEMFENVGVFFEGGAGGRPGPQLLEELLDSAPNDLLEALRRIVPDEPEIRAELDLDAWRWTPGLLNARDGVLTKAAAEVENDLDEYKHLEEEASQQRNYGRAGFYQRHRNRIRHRQLLGFLAARNVLPKYGFPVDVVELQVTSADDTGKELELQRDLKIAISEYAPGGQVVAGHKVWESNGLRRLPHREPPEYAYVICRHCGRFHKRISAEDLPQSCEACNGDLVLNQARSPG